MKLDMFVYRTGQPIPAVDFTEPPDAEEIAHWRNHPNLDGWMMVLYRIKHGQDPIFHRSTLQLSATDLDALQADVLADALPITDGHPFGASRPEYRELDLAFISRARQALAEGFFVYYWPDW